MSRNADGFQPPRRYSPFQADKGPWLIWSYHWNCWHRRSETGSAAGYTSDLTQAGVFDAKIARAYHDNGPRKHRRDVSIPAAKVRAAMLHHLAKMTADRDAFAAKIAALNLSNEESQTNGR